MTIDSFLGKLLEHCGLDPSDIKVEIMDGESVLSVLLQLPENESGAVIGFHGEVLDSIQRILRVVFASEYENQKIVLDLNNYRQQRSEKLKQLTIDVAQKVLQSGQPYTFRSFLPSYERFIVHSTLAESGDFKELESISSGEGRMRRLTIQAKS